MSQRALLSLVEAASFVTCSDSLGIACPRCRAPRGHECVAGGVEVAPHPERRWAIGLAALRKAVDEAKAHRPPAEVVG